MCALLIARFNHNNNTPYFDYTMQSNQNNHNNSNSFSIHSLNRMLTRLQSLFSQSTARSDQTNYEICNLLYETFIRPSSFSSARLMEIGTNQQNLLLLQKQLTDTYHQFRDSFLIPGKENVSFSNSIRHLLNVMYCLLQSLYFIHKESKFESKLHLFKAIFDEFGSLLTAIYEMEEHYIDRIPVDYQGRFKAISDLAGSLSVELDWVDKNALDTQELTPPSEPRFEPNLELISNTAVNESIISTSSESTNSSAIELRLSDIEMTSNDAIKEEKTIVTEEKQSNNNSSKERNYSTDWMTLFGMKSKDVPKSREEVDRSNPKSLEAYKFFREQRLKHDKKYREEHGEEIRARDKKRRRRSR